MFLLYLWLLQETDDRWMLNDSSIWNAERCLVISNMYVNEMKRGLQIKLQNAHFRMAGSVVASDITLYFWLLNGSYQEFVSDISVFNTSPPYHQYADDFNDCYVQFSDMGA
jgi:hypothetical protein